MAYFEITGATNFTLTGNTVMGSATGIKWNDAAITAFYKRDGRIGSTNVYYLYIVFGTRLESFQFTDKTQRDGYYNAL